MGLEENILRSLRRITRAIDLHSRHLAAKHQLTAPQLVCLRHLASESPTTPGMLAKNVSLSQATVTGILDRLEKKGLVVRKRDQKDRRRVSLHLTDLGLKVIEAAPTLLQEHFVRRLDALPPAEQTKISEVLEQVVEMMEAGDLAAAPLITTGNVEASSREVGQFLEQEAGPPQPDDQEKH